MTTNQSTDNNNITLRQLISLFRVEALTKPEVTSRSYLKAVASFEQFGDAHGIGDATVCNNVAAEWLVYMFVCGLSFKTSGYYLDVVAGLYNSAAKKHALPESPFKRIKTQRKTAGESCWHADIDYLSLSALKQLLEQSTLLRGELRLAADILRLCLLTAMSPAKAAMLRTDSIDNLADISNEAADIAGEHVDGRRKYIFPLRQSELTPRQLEKRLHGLLARLLMSRGLPYAQTSEATTEAYWTAAALNAGIAGTSIRSVLGHTPSSALLLDMCQEENLDRDAFRQTIESVARTFLPERPQWFAMRLRRGVKFDTVEARLQTLDAEVAAPEIFYPCNEIAKRVGRRMITDRQPVIPDIVFFRCRRSNVFNLFCHIGDLAWCYTVPGTGIRNYAAIPAVDFDIFQRTIGMFTNDCEVAPIGTLTPRPDERVVLVGGLFQGCDARFRNTENDNTLYRLEILGDNGFEWRINVDPRLVRL